MLRNSAFPIALRSLAPLQVQLLVSQNDVDNYKQIKTDLDDLRLLVEKSELWVYKSHKGSSEKAAKNHEESEGGSESKPAKEVSAEGEILERSLFGGHEMFAPLRFSLNLA